MHTPTEPVGVHDDEPRSDSAAPEDPRTARSADRILVVEDDATIRSLVTDVLEEVHYRVTAVDDGEEALKALDQESFDVVLLDLQLPRLSGLNVLAALPSVRTDARFIVMTAFGTVESAVEAMKLGAWDYIRKPFKEDELLLLVSRAAEDAALRREVAELRRLATSDRLRDLVGRSPAMRRLFRTIERVAPTRATVLVVGETGTGKELVAHAIHDLSDRSRRPFVAVNCSALPDTLLESELFGHMKGSFTGAVQSRPGLIEEAAGGTLFLDEVSTLSEDIQVKLLRVLQERRVQRIGSRTPLAVDFRLIAATNTDLAALVREGRFREDLYYRLDVFPVEVPPLRERTIDIPLLANYFRLRFAEEHGLDPPELPHETLSRMMAYSWPGNVRELENTMERAVIMAGDGEPLHFEPRTALDSSETGLTEKAHEEGWDLAHLEQEYILQVLERCRWQKGLAAKTLGISRRTLYRKLTTYREAGVLPDVAD